MTREVFLFCKDGCERPLRSTHTQQAHDVDEAVISELLEKQGGRCFGCGQDRGSLRPMTVVA